MCNQMPIYKIEQYFKMFEKTAREALQQQTTNAL